MTSLIDVIFLLLLFFMLSSTFSKFAEVELTAGGAGAATSSTARPLFLQLGPETARLNSAELALEALPEALAERPKIHLAERPALWTEWFGRQGVELENANEGHWVDEIALAIETVRAGLGYALLPLYLIEQELAAGTLRVALDAPYSTDMAYYIVTPEGRADSAAGFRDWLIGQVSFRPLARGV